MSPSVAENSLPLYTGPPAEFPDAPPDVTFADADLASDIDEHDIQSSYRQGWTRTNGLYAPTSAPPHGTGGQRRSSLNGRPRPDGDKLAGLFHMPAALSTPQSPLPALSEIDVDGKLTRWCKFIIQFDIRHIGIAIGFSSFVSLWRSLSLSFRPYQFPREIYFTLWYFTVALTAVVFGLYAYRSLNYPHLLYRDFTNNALTNFFGGFGIVVGGLIISTPPPTLRMNVAKTWFFILLAYQGVLALYWYSDWLFASGHSLRKVSALYFMAVINFFILSNLGAKVGFVEEASILFMIGTIFWLVVLVSMFAFLSKSFDEGLESPSPTLFLFIAPPAAAAIAWIGISRARGDPLLNDMVRFYSAVDFFIYLLLLRLFFTLIRLKFNVSFWAYIFPIGTAASLAVELTQLYSSNFIVVIAAAASIVCVMMILVVSTLTVRGVYMGQIPKSELSLRVHFQKLGTDAAGCMKNDANIQAFREMEANSSSTFRQDSGSRSVPNV